MELREMLSKKPVKFLTLLLTSMLIAAASAAVYNYMYMEASPISVETPEVRFVDGPDAACTPGANGTYVKITDLAGWPNATRVYENATAVEELANADHTCELMFDSWSGDTANVTYIYVKVFNATGVQQGSTLSVTAQNSTGQFTLKALATYRVQFEIMWEAGALSTYSVDVTLKLKVM